MRNFSMDPNQLQAFANPDGGEDVPPVDETEDMQEGGIGRFSELIPLLEEFAEDIEGLLDEVDYDLLADMEAELPPQDMELLKQGLTTLDKRLQDVLRTSLAGGISDEEALEIGEHLEAEEMVTDAARVGGWLKRIQSMMAEVDGEKEDPEDESEILDEEVMEG